MIDNIIYIIFISLVATNIISAYFYFRLKNKTKQAPKSYELQLFLHDIMRGDGIVRVSRIDPNDIFLRSPKNV